MKVLYDEGTSEEKWLIGVAVEKLSEESHSIYFLEDQEVAAVSNSECEEFDEEAGGYCRCLDGNIRFKSQTFVFLLLFFRLGT